MQDDVRSSEVFLIFRINTRDNTDFCGCDMLHTTSFRHDILTTMKG